MAWETRGNKRYFYRKRREGDRVLSEYIGSGRGAMLISRMEEILRDRAETDRQVELLRRREAEEGDEEVGQVWRVLASLTHMTLEANGYHKHKGEWRRKRGE